MRGYQPVSSTVIVVTALVGLSGSLRRGSYNTALLRAAATMLPAGVTLEQHTLHGIPLYDGDVEASEGIPAAVAALKDAIARADGILLVTPEYNNSIPGVFKNAIDWLSRPPADVKRVFSDRPVALLGASSGNFGTILSQNAWLAVLRTLGTRPWFGAKLMVPRAQSVFSADGTLQDPAVREQLRSYLAGFVDSLRP